MYELPGHQVETILIQPQTQGPLQGFVVYGVRVDDSRTIVPTYTLSSTVVWKRKREENHRYSQSRFNTIPSVHRTKKVNHGKPRSNDSLRRGACYRSRGESLI